MVFAIKDVFKVKGSTYSNGHPLWLKTHDPDDFTASSVTTLLDNGADLVGKTVCDELCYSISGENWNYGAPLNPHDLRRYTGGSSSGSAAATAGGLVDFATGSDCLGSVRVPASYNGLLGMRPTLKRVKNDGEAPYSETMDVLGYVASDPNVFKKVSSVLLGKDPDDTPFKKVFIATDAFDAVDKDVKDAFAPAIRQIIEKVGPSKEVTIAKEGLDTWVSVFKDIQGYEVWDSYGGWVNKYRPHLSRGPKERLESASKITKSAYDEAQKKRTVLIEQFKTLMSKDAVLVLPTASSIAPLRTETLDKINKHRAQSSKLLCISPLTKAPQVTVPLTTMHGVPLGITLIASHEKDMMLASLASELLDDFLNRARQS
jgi:amidase